MVEKPKVPIAVFASGFGSNLEALLHAEQPDAKRQKAEPGRTEPGRLEARNTETGDPGGWKDEWPARIALVVSDNPDSLAIAKARTAGRPTCARRPREFTDKAAFEQAILVKLYEYNVEWIFLAGYMRLIGPTLLRAYEGKIVNIHPSRLPDFPGRDAIGDALAAAVETTGVTVHYVDEGIDTGAIIAQEIVPIGKGMTKDQLEQRIHRVEHELYPRVVRQLLS